MRCWHLNNKNCARNPHGRMKDKLDGSSNQVDIINLFVGSWVTFPQNLQLGQKDPASHLKPPTSRGWTWTIRIEEGTLRDEWRISWMVLPTKLRLPTCLLDRVQRIHKTYNVARNTKRANYKLQLAAVGTWTTRMTEGTHRDEWRISWMILPTKLTLPTCLLDRG